MKRIVTLIGLIALLGSAAVFAAKIVPAYETQKLPQMEDEAELWVRASNHENRLRNAGTRDVSCARSFLA